MPKVEGHIKKRETCREINFRIVVLRGKITANDDGIIMSLASGTNPSLFLCLELSRLSPSQLTLCDDFSIYSGVPNRNAALLLIFWKKSLTLCLLGTT